MDTADRLLFTDWRHVQGGHLAWRTADQQALGVGHPPGEPVALHAVPRQVPHGVRLQAQRPRKLGPVDDWKGWGRIIHEDGRYRTWYLKINGVSRLGTGSNADLPRPDRVTICTATSSDGVAWAERELHDLDLGGHHHFDGLTFLIDPAAAAAERYKFVYCAIPAADEEARLLGDYARRHPRWRDQRLGPGRGWCLWALTSPDGERWTPHREPLLMHPSDTDTTITYDAWLQRYVLYTRLFRQDRRWIGRAESEDFWHWGPIEPVVQPDLADRPDRDIYLNGYTTVPGLPRQHLMLTTHYHRLTERSHIRLRSSDDNVAWAEVPGGPIVEGGEPGEWDSEFIGSGKDLLPWGADHFAAPYSATAYPHKYPRWPGVFAAWQQGWLVWERDRLSALVADAVGEIWTIPRLPGKRRLTVNARVPMGGEVRVGIVGCEGRGAADCTPITGDSLTHPVTWSADPTIPVAPDTPVVLHVALRAAELFAINWE